MSVSEPSTPPPGDPNPGTPAPPPPNVNLTADTVVSITNSLLGLLAVANPASAAGIAAIKGGIILVNGTLIPLIRPLVTGGHVSVEWQSEVRSKYNEYRAIFADAFLPPEWQVEE